MLPVQSIHIGKEIIEALGLPPETRSIDVRFAVGEVVQVTCCFFPDKETVDKFCQIMRRYHIVPREEDSADLKVEYP